MEDKNADTDSSQSDFDEVDGGNILVKAKRKIVKYFKPKKRVLDHPEGYSIPESTSMQVESDAYDFNHPNRGICVIISNEDFWPGTNLGPRPSSDKDVTLLKKAFRDLDFFVKVYKNLTGEGIDKKLRKVAQKYPHHNADCLVCIILSHGGTGEIPDVKRKRVEKLEFVYGTDGSPISVRYVTSLFNDEGCPDLTGKPRVFLFQACRGTKREKGVAVKVMVAKSSGPKQWHHKKSSDKADGDKISDTPDAKPEATQETEGATGIGASAGSYLPPSHIEEEDYLDEEDPMTISPSPCYMDSLVMFASPPGYFAFLRGNGSWLMTSLCEAIGDAMKSNPNKVDFIQVLTRTSYKMAINFKSSNKQKPEIHNCKVVPSMMSSLTKHIIFEPKPSPPEVQLNP